MAFHEPQECLGWLGETTSQRTRCVVTLCVCVWAMFVSTAEAEAL